jgi:hypothetical protein
MKKPETREIAEHWFRVLKSAPHADSWKIEDDFVGKLTAAWPWITVYVELLSKERHRAKEEFDWAVTLGVCALKDTLGLRFDCATAFLMLLLMSRVIALGQAIPEKVEDMCAEAVDRLVENENDKTDRWLKWFGELWRIGPK